MGVIGRFTDIMSANINAVLTKMEENNAEELLQKYLRDAKKNLDAVKSETAAIMAAETGAKRKLDECDAEISKFGNYVVAALKAGNDSDAKKFLSYKNELETKRLNLEKDYVEAKANSEKMRQMTEKLTDDIRAAQSKLQELSSKLAIAKEQEKLNQMNQKLNTNQLDNFDNLMDTIQQRIDAAEARAELDRQSAPGADINELAAKYDVPASAGNSGDTLDDELLKMKAELGLL